MPLAVREGDLSLGHCWPPTPATGVVSRSVGVYVNNLPAVVVGDAYLPHPGPCGNQGTHPVFAGVGSSTVFIANLPVVRAGDPLTCGDIAGVLGGNVYVG